jgi:hypothetical protein
MPSIDSEILFFISIGPAILLTVILHEAGHVLAARCVGVAVAAWGIGYRQPWFYRRIGSTIFYVGRPLASGLTIARRSRLERQPLKEFVLVLGGPLATAFGLAAGFTACRWGAQSDPIAAWVYVSFFYLIGSIIPYTDTTSLPRIDNDASQLFQIVRRGRELAGTPIGPALASTQAVVELLATIQCKSGMRFFHSARAVMQAALGDTSNARASLEEACLYSDENSLFHYARAAIATADNTENSEDFFEIGREACYDDPTARFAIACMHEEWRHRQGRGNCEQRQLLRQQALQASRRDWLCWAEELIFEADIFEDVEANCRTLLADFRQQLNGVSRARLLVVAAQRLASLGDFERAKVVASEAEAAIAQEAASIATAETRAAYLRSAGEPLQEVAQTINIAPPNFEPVALEHHLSRRRIFAFISLALSAPSLMASVIGATIAEFAIHNSTLRLAFALQALAVFGSLLTLAAIAVSILRSESSRWRILSVTLVFAFLIMAIAGVTLSKS